MQAFPGTRHTLLVRLRNPADEEAWAEFVGIYRPVLYRLIRRKGFQHADAEELAQEALLAVAGAIGRFDPNPERGRFRAWLARIVRNMMINFLVRSRPENFGVGGSGFQHLLEAQPARSPADESVFLLEYRREVFGWAARRVRSEVQPATWQAFWRTCIEGCPIADCASELELSVGAVYLARSRIVARLRRCVGRFEESAP